MKQPASKLTLITGMLALACLFTVPMANAASDDAKADKKKKKLDAELRKYDRNGNGRLDPDEEAARRADAEREKSEKRRKKN